MYTIVASSCIKIMVLLRMCQRINQFSKLQPNHQVEGISQYHPITTISAGR